MLEMKSPMRVRRTSLNNRPARATGPAWHALSAEETLRRLEAQAGGLSSEEAARRLAAHGPNRLPAPQRTGPLGRFLAQFDNLLIYVLLGSAVITLFLGHTVD